MTLLPALLIYAVSFVFAWMGADTVDRYRRVRERQYLVMALIFYVAAFGFSLLGSYILFG